MYLNSAQTIHPQISTPILMYPLKLDSRIEIDVSKFIRLRDFVKGVTFSVTQNWTLVVNDVTVVMATSLINPRTHVSHTQPRISKVPRVTLSL